MTLSDERIDGVGRTMQLGLLVRWLYFGSIAGSGTLLGLVAHFDHTWWFASHFGFTFRAVAGVLTSGRLGETMPEVDLGVGLSF